MYTLLDGSDGTGKERPAAQLADPMKWQVTSSEETSIFRFHQIHLGIAKLARGISALPMTMESAIRLSEESCLIESLH